MAVIASPAGSPLVYVRYWKRRRPHLRFSDGTVLERLPVTWAIIAVKFLPALYALGIAFLIVAMARPQKGLDESRVRTEAVDIVLVVDVSTSMEALDFATATRQMNRLDAAKVVVDRFIKNRPNDRIGLVAFAAMPYTISPLTLDHAWLVQQLDRLYTGMLEDRTAIGDALASGINRLRDSKAKSKVVVLLTDGMNNFGKLPPRNAAEAAKALGIRIYTVGAGKDGMVRMPGSSFFGPNMMPSQIDEATLKDVAATTEGRYFRATDLSSLQAVYDDIDAMEKTEIEVEQFTRFEERFAGFLVFGLVCLGLEKILATTRLARVP